MPILFKLVGVVNLDSKVPEIKKDIVGSISLSDIKQIFKDYGLNEEELEQIKFVANSETIKTNDKTFLISNDNEFVIFVFSAISYIRAKLISIFPKNSINILDNENNEKVNINNNNSNEKISVSKKETDNELLKKIDSPEVNIIPVLTEEIINKMNEETSKLFESEDFKHLIRIYYTNQDVMKTFFSFINNGDIVKMDIPKDSSKTFEEEIKILKSLGITENDDAIKDCLKVFNGHLNLSLRTLLVRKSVLDTK